MESKENEIDCTIDETRKSSDSQRKIISVFHNYALHSTKNTSETMSSNNVTIPSTELPSSENTNLYKSIIFKVGASYICPECKETFLYLKNLKRHVQKQHPSLLSTIFPSIRSSSTHKCNICKEKFFYLVDFKRHAKNEHPCLSPTSTPSVEINGSHKCPICQEFYTYRKNLRRHVKTKHPDSFFALFPSSKPTASFECSICKRTFSHNKNLKRHVMTKHPDSFCAPSSSPKHCNSFECSACKRTFLHSKNLKRHVMKMHPSLFSILFSSVRSSASHKCNICKRYFKNVTSFESHNCNSKKRRKKHNCPLCPETLGVTKFSDHFEKCHNLFLKPVKINFESYADFCEWKKAIENVTRSYFTKYSFRESNGILHYNFICHRSGTFKSSAVMNKRKLKSKGSKKINAYCPAAMKVVLLEKDGKCNVAFQSQHLGHENELEHLYLTHEERKYIADKLATNLPLDDVLNDIRSSASIMGAERLSQITRKDLHNIKSNFLKNKQSDTSAEIPNQKLTHDLRDIHNKHAESQHIKADITTINKGWALTFLEHNEIYLIKENSKSCDCPLVCIYCRVCIKSYICSCSDSCEGNMCKHIHFFCMERNKTFDASDSNDFFNFCNNEATNSSNSEQCGYPEKCNDMLATKKLLNRNNDNVFVDSEKRNILKNKFSDLIDSLTTEEEYKLSKNTIEELATKLKSMQNHSLDTVISATYNPVEVIYVDESTQDQHNMTSATEHH